MLAKLFDSIALKLTLVAIALLTILFSADIPALADSTTNFDRGAKIFEANCAACHVKGKNIVRRGKNLKMKALHRYKVDTVEAIVDLVTNGKGIMSAYGDKLTQQEIIDVSAYVLERAEQNWK